RGDERAGVALPALDVVALEAAEALAERLVRGADGLGLAVAEAQREREVAAVAEVDLRGLDEVAAGGVRERRGQPAVRGVELGQPVARLAGKAVGDRAEAAIRVERGVDRDRVV